MKVFLLCAVCTDAENEKNSAVDRWHLDAYTEATSKSQAMHSDAVSFACMDISNFRGRFSTQDSSFDE